jgi:hypothetical protein
LIEELAEYTGELTLEESKEAYVEAKKFFTRGILPGGTKWLQVPPVKLGFDNAPEVTRVKKKESGDTIIYSARVVLAPGKGGGGGVGADSRDSNHIFNLLGTDAATIKGVKKAFAEKVKMHKNKLNSLLEGVLKKRLLERLVGYENRNDYVLKDVSFKRVRYGEPMVDPTRRKWPAGRTEIWVPITVDLMATVRRK